MAEVREFALPDLGEGLTEAEIVRWLVAPGDAVAVDQPVVEVETAKAMVEVPCPYAGLVMDVYGEPGAEVPVGATLLTVAVGRAAEAGPSAASPASPASPASAADEGSGNVLVGYGTSSPAARRRRVRRGAPPGGASGGRAGRAGGMAGAGFREPGVAVGAGAADAGFEGDSGAGAADAGSERADGASAADAGSERADGASAPDAGSKRDSGARVTDDDPEQADGPPAVISPLVRRLAREHGLDLRRIAGSGPDGLILRADVERAAGQAAAGAASGAASEAASGAAAQAAAEAAARAVPEAATQGVPEAAAQAPPETAVRSEGERIPLKGIRGAVADKLSRSRREIPDASCWVDADATELLAARQAMNAAGGPGRISLLGLLARVVTAALARFPELNATVEGREIVRLPAVHLGFAAQTERGLVVPVVRDAHTLSAARLSAEISRLTEAARTGSLSPADLTGGTFTLNNYGVFGVDGSTPILNHPEAAMLGVGRIAPKPWVHAGELAVRQVVQLSFTFDHRVCDGGTAGGFLRYVADCVEEPAVLLRDL